MKCLFDPQVGTLVLFSNDFNTFDIPIKLPISNANLLDNNQGVSFSLLHQHKVLSINYQVVVLMDTVSHENK